MRAPAILLLSALFSSQANALTVSEYLDASEDFKSGYVFGMMEALTLIYSNDEADNQRSLKLLKCLMNNKVNSKEGVRIVGRHILQNPEATATPMFSVVIKAFNNSCKSYLE
jgi:hypothetical protein